MRMHRVKERKKLCRDYLLDETRIHDIDGHRGVRDRPECRRIEFCEAAFCDRLQTEFLQKCAGTTTVS